MLGVDAPDINPGVHEVPAQVLWAAIVNDQLAAVEEPSAVGRAYLIDVVTDRPPADHPLVVLGVYDED